MIPLLDEDAKDERFDGVILVEYSDGDKTTAEDCGVYWYIRNFEIMDIKGKQFWFSRFGYSISKKIIEQLEKAE